MSLAERAAALDARIAAACARAGRPRASVRLIAVSKTQPPEAIREAMALGLRDFGENYVQEWTAKRDLIPEVAWHFIGRLQRNKAKDVAGLCALIHTVDSLALAEALDKRAAAPQDILIQVNVAGEEQKGGIAPGELPALVEALAKLTKVRCRGLMTIPPAATVAEDNRPHFRALAQLARESGLPDLSMGMSDDFEVAIEEGATWIRVGSALFGPRS